MMVVSNETYYSSSVFGVCQFFAFSETGRAILIIVIGYLSVDRIREIRAIMSNFTLPSNNIPEWAHLVPEGEWKAKLMSLTRCCAVETEINRRSVALEEQ
jgi:hypothetical protein